MQLNHERQLLEQAHCRQGVIFIVFAVWNERWSSAHPVCTKEQWQAPATFLKLVTLQYFSIYSGLDTTLHYVWKFAHWDCLHIENLALHWSIQPGFQMDFHIAMCVSEHTKWDVCEFTYRDCHVCESKHRVCSFIKLAISIARLCIYMYLGSSYVLHMYSDSYSTNGSFHIVMHDIRLLVMSVELAQ